MKKRLVFLIVSILLMGCGNSKLQGVNVYDFSVDVENYKPLDESDYYLNYEILPMDTAYCASIYQLRKVVMNDRFIYTFSDGVNVKVFNRQGKYLKSIPHGRAGNELIAPMDMFLDDKTGNILFLDALDMIKTYDSLGNHLHTKKLDFIAKEVVKINNRYLFFDSNMSQQDSNFLLLEGDKKTYYSRKRGASEPMHGANTHITKYKNDFYFRADFDNVVYRIGQNGEVKEYAVFANYFGDESVKNQDVFDLIKMCKGVKLLSTDPFLILNDDLYCMGYLVRRSGVFLYDRLTNTPYKHPLDGLYTLGGVRGYYRDKTIHYLSHEYITNTGVKKMDRQAKVVYDKLKEMEKKNGEHENIYLIIVSYLRKE